MKQELVAFFREEDGVTAIEYGIIAGVIAVGLIAILEPVRGALGTLFTKIVGELNGAGGAGTDGP